MSPRQKAIMESEIKCILGLGIIECEESDYTHLMTIAEVPRKGPRPCVEHSKLNEVTRDETYPIPNTEDKTEAVS